jgi:hypothetical protein
MHQQSCNVTVTCLYLKGHNFWLYLKRTSREGKQDSIKPCQVSAVRKKLCHQRKSTNGKIKGMGEGERQREKGPGESKETEWMRWQKGTTFIVTRGGDRKFTTLKAPRQYPLVLLVKIGWKQSRAMGSEERSSLGSGILGVWGYTLSAYSACQAFFRLNAQQMCRRSCRTVKANGSLHRICNVMVQDKMMCMCVRVWLRIYQLQRLTAPTQTQIKKPTYKPYARGR